MAQMKVELPYEIIQELNKLEKNTKEIFGKVTRAGAEELYSSVKKNLPENFKKSKIRECLKITKTYETISDDGINTKVGFFGDFNNRNNKKTLAPLVANVFEYGSSKFAGLHFFRKSFNKKRITEKMLEAQRKLTNGKLE